VERAIDPLLTIDAKLWADEFMATKQRLGDAEFDHVMMLGWFANAIMRGYDAGRDSMTHTPPHPDAQATIAALQARVNGLEKDSELLRQSRDDFRIKYESVKNDAITLRSHLTQRTAELHETQNHLADADNEVEQLRKQLSERTAELEAVQRERDEWRRSAEASDDANDIIVRDLQAELERVKGELAETKEEVKCLDEQVSALNQGCLEYERLIAALPKVEGDDAAALVYGSWWRKGGNEQQFDAALSALLQHRQGMEG